MKSIFPLRSLRLCILGASWFLLFSSATAQVPRAADVVAPEAYVSLAPVPRGRAVELAVVARIRSGFHINSHKPTDEYLIPTALSADLPPGLRLLDTVYPPGQIRKFKFAPDGLSVYENGVTLRMKLEAAADAPLGQRKVPLLLHYQACNDEVCLPPVKLPLTAEIEIAPAGAAAQPQHPEIFSAPAAKQ